MPALNRPSSSARNPKLCVQSGANLVRLIPFDDVSADIELGDVSNVRVSRILRVPVASDLLGVVEVQNRVEDRLLG
jgi:hypothetical protein